jgi:pyridoxine 4-dehydrogenase
LGIWRRRTASAGTRHLQPDFAWLLHHGDHVLLIPGTGSIAHLEENMAAGAVELGPRAADRLRRVPRAAAARR